MTPERDDLTVVEQHIRAAKEYIYKQERLIERLADEAKNTDDAFALLNILNRALRLFERYQLSTRGGDGGVRQELRHAASTAHRPCIGAARTRSLRNSRARSRRDRPRAAAGAHLRETDCVADDAVHYEPVSAPNSQL